MMRQTTALLRLTRAFKPALFAGITVLAVAGAGTALAQSEQQPLTCGSLDNAFGPFDYRHDRDKLSVVERFHFGVQVEAGTRGTTSQNAGSDLDYTLRAFPNHHRALLALMRYSDRLKSPQPPGLHYPVECYFDRALRFKSNDVVARMIYVQYLIKLGRNKDATAQLEITKAQAEDSPFTHFNVGLLYFDMKDYPRAREQAHKAAALGFQRTELRDQLQKVGQWKEPEAAPPPATAASAPAASKEAEPPVPASSAPAQ